MTETIAPGGYITHHFSDEDIVGVDTPARVLEIGEWVVGPDGMGRRVTAIEGDRYYLSEPVRVFDRIVGRRILDRLNKPEEGQR